VSLKHEIESRLGLPVKLKAGMPGAMDIYLDRELFYSKGRVGKMPQNADIVSAIMQRQGAPTSL